MSESVVVGISGGVDSLMTAILLKEKGYRVVSVNLVLWGEKQENPLLADLCQRLNIELIYADVRKLFKTEIIDSFVHGYLNGVTPNPCTICNPLIKWETLKKVADERGVEKMATGHYIQIAKYNGNYYIHKSKDVNKDQSYFLWGLGQDILSRAITPLGNYRKEEVKQMAVEYGFKEMAAKRESMGICFLQGKDYRDFIKTYTGKENNHRGDIKDREGTVIGEHIGILNYTIGQKTGILNKQGLPLYVWD
ncbi:MAG: tRNA-specific 2-thiouridylase, partial [Odoribacter sp.]|nr:tRNA-specific 2-thiouridylase [Odoribacter sp.]